MVTEPDVTADHEASPAPFSAYSMDGPNTGRPANLASPRYYPAEALCGGCGAMIRAEHYGDPWVHNGRMPGDPC
jgi:hypothetical protein